MAEALKGRAGLTMAHCNEQLHFVENEQPAKNCLQVKCFNLTSNAKKQGRPPSSLFGSFQHITELFRSHDADWFIFWYFQTVLKSLGAEVFVG